MGKKNITFSDIAKYTGFSKTTISRYFNNPDYLTLENQQIISDALDKLNYQENKVARILANGKSLRKESKVVQTKKQYGDFSLTALSFASISIFSG